ncbi:MAG: hypothetical protein WKG01_26755 [Kofleriaceae bacterium]
MAGDGHLIGERDELGWIVSRARVPDAPEPVCEPEPASSAVCAREPTVVDEAIAEGVVTLPPALYLNGFGWDLATGQVPPATYVYVEDPQFIELDLATTGDGVVDWSRAARVSIAAHQLRLVSLATTAHGARLTFVADRPLPGIRVAFLAFGDDRELDHRSRGSRCSACAGDDHSLIVT